MIRLKKLLIEQSNITEKSLADINVNTSDLIVSVTDGNGTELAMGSMATSSDVLEVDMRKVMFDANEFINLTITNVNFPDSPPLVVKSVKIFQKGEGARGGMYKKIPGFDYEHSDKYGLTKLDSGVKMRFPPDEFISLDDDLSNFKLKKLTKEKIVVNSNIDGGLLKVILNFNGSTIQTDKDPIRR